tara:strand:+ start:67 stop:1485 length:1419 start_codon:yes stop_codon:yes gene_type:complete
LSAATSPNIIVVLADDLGYGDLGCYGNSEVHTPHIDHFASEGLKFTDCYAAAANCSPSRAGLMTGRTPWRLGIHNWIPMLSPMHVKESEITIASLLKDAGYDTCHVGKWHLNGMFNLPGQPQPNDHGFDHWFSIQNNALPNHRNPYNFVRNGIPVGPIDGYSADIVTDEAIQWLETERNSGRPFFLFVCYSEPHEPVVTAERHSHLYADKEDPAERALLGNITQLDAGFGRLMQAVDDLELRDDTLILFTSDNGPAITGKHPYGSAAPLRAKKGYLWEGGIRVPGLLRWPGHTHPESTCKEPISGVDLLPTLCEIAQVEPPGDRAIDGTSWLPLLRDEPVDRDTPLYWHFLRAKGSVKVSIREGDWKLVASIDQPDLRPSGGITQDDIDYQTRAQLTDFALYDLTRDIAEATDLKDTEAERFNAMKHTLSEMYDEVREESPVWPVWEFPHYEGMRIEWPEYKALIKPPVYVP